MSASASNGWNESAAAWLDAQGDHGDFGRRFVLDAPMIARVRGRGFGTALDVGCGEGRFCRLLRNEGIVSVGIDPTQALIDRARQLDPEGDYRLGQAEAMNVADGSFDLVVSYLTLIDIPDLAGAASRMIAALRPGGTLLIANLNSFSTAGQPTGWIEDENGEPRYIIDNYLEARAMWVSWRGIRIQNWHRPLSVYMTLFIDHGLQLRHFSEPAPTGGDPDVANRYRRVPYFHIMEWQKPMG